MRAPGQLRRLRIRRTPPITLYLDGRPIEAREGDSVLGAVMGSAFKLRVHEFDGKPRGGFCAMGACQDCWVWLENGKRLRACTALAEDGLRISTTPTLVGA